MSRSVRLPALLLTLVLMPSEVSAQEVLNNGVNTVVLTTGATLANIAGLFPAVGSGIGVAYELPNRRWAIAGTVAGGFQLTFGALSVASGLAEERNLWLTAYGAVTAAMGAGNLILGLINLFKSHRALRRIDLMDAPYLSVAPVDLGNGGVGIALTMQNASWSDGLVIE